MEFTPSDWNKIQNLSTQQLADCPWPIAGSHCSPCTIYRPSGSPYQIVFNIWGEFAGDATRQRYYAQQGCTDYSPIMRFVCKVGRFRTTAVPTNDGLFIGLVTLAVLNDTAKLHDPSQWQWAGYLATLPGGTPVVPYWICADVNLAWTPTTPLYLLMCTNGSYEVCGWDMVGYTDTSFPQALPLNEWNYNEPNKPNGWTAMDNRYKGAFHIYSPPGGQLVEGLSDIVNPSFCTTVQEGANCAFSFDVNQLTAFPCGCPETIVWQLFDRDTSQPIANAVQFLLDCGYTGVTGFGGNLVFSGAGTFHGQLKAGHLTTGTQWVVDDTYNFDITITPLPCTNWTTQSTCTSHGCYWWNGSCHSAQPTACSQLNNQTDCTTYGCYWYNNTCNSSPPTCSSYTTQATCEANDCYWWNGSCHSTSPTCTDLNNQTDCTTYGCYWYNSSCHSTPQSCTAYTTQVTCIQGGCFWYNGSCHSNQPTCTDFNNQTDCINYYPNDCYWYNNSCHSTPQQGICEWVTNHGGATGLDVSEVFQIIDSYVLQTPPTGYSFIPTLTQVFGIIDYYLGFIASGNEKTGCSF